MTDFYTNFFQRGSKIYIRGYRDGLAFKDSYEFPCSIYVPCKEQSKYKTIYKEPLKKIDFLNPREAKEFAKSYEEAGQKVYGFPKFAYTHVFEEYKDVLYKDFMAEHINIMVIDIETTVDNGFPNIFTANEEILLITASLHGKYTTFSTRPLTKVIEGIDFICCKSEADMLTKFIQFFRKSNVHAISGWNTNGFDMPFLVNRISRILGEDAPKALSPFGMIDVKAQTFKGRDEISVNIFGIANLDYLEVYQKFVLDPREDYKLDTIADIELNDRKLPFDGSFKEHYTNHWDHFVEYNIHDVRLIDKLDNKLRLFDIIKILAYKGKINYDDIFATTRLWDSILANELHRNNTFGPYSFRHFGDGYEGAYVKPTIPGFYEWAMSFDLESLYPKLIIQYNISPEMMLEPSTFHNIRAEDFLANNDKYKAAQADAIQKNASLCLNGAMFRREEQGFIPRVTQQMFEERKKAKSESLQWKSRLQEAKIELKKRGISYD